MKSNYIILLGLSILLISTSPIHGGTILDPFVSPCAPEPADKCQFQDTYPCTWTGQACNYSSSIAVFFCDDVPDTASFSYTITPQNSPVSASPEFSVTLWGDNTPTEPECIANIQILESQWISKSQAVRKTLPPELIDPINTDDLNTNIGSLDFTNGIHSWPSTVLSTTNIPFTGNAGYMMFISRESFDTINTECMDISIDLSFT